MRSIQGLIDGIRHNSQPRGFDDIDVEVFYNVSERTLLASLSDLDLTFTGDAYAYLFKSMNVDGYNGRHTYEIQLDMGENTYETVFYGIIFNADCEWNLDPRYCKANVLDYGYQSHIKNNLKNETHLLVPKTKNGNDIDTARLLTQSTVTLFNPPSSGTAGLSGVGNTRKVYKVEDVLDFLIAFMTDNEINFQTDFFDNLTTDGLSYGMIYGMNLRLNTEADPPHGMISFGQVMLDLARLFNLLLSVSIVDGVPTVRLEDLDYYRASGVAVQKRNIAEINQSFVQDLLYANIEIGSLESSIDNSIGDLAYLPPFDFGQDSYYLTGQSNLDNTLNLRCETFITDSNIIEDIIVNSTDSWDDNWFLISFDNSALNFKTDASDIFNDGNYYYNGELLNKNVVARYQLQGAAIKMAGDPDGDFVGRKGLLETIDYLTGVPTFGNIVTAKFNNIILDPLGNWNTGTHRYTATNAGIVNVQCNVDTRLNSGTLNPASSPDPLGNNRVLSYTITPRFKKNGTYMLAPDGTFLGEDSKKIFPLWQNTIINNTAFVYPIYLGAADYLEIEYDIVIGAAIYTIFGGWNSVAGNTGVWWRDIDIQGFGNSPPIIETQTVGWVTAMLIDVLESCSMTIVAQGSINGAEISDKVQDAYFISKFEFEDDLTIKETKDYLANTQKSILLFNSEHNIKTKLWTYRVRTNLSTGKTKFGLFNNIINQ